MSDLISRLAAITQLSHNKNKDDDEWELNDCNCNSPDPAPIQPKKGKWIKTARWGRVYYCNQCRNYLDFDGVNAGRGSTNFCPNCGADMRGEQNEDY